MPKKETLRKERTTNNGVLAAVSGKRIGIFSNGRIFPDALHVANVPTAFLAAIVLGLLNMSVKPILLVLSLPITVVTLGIFYLIINGLMLELTSVVMGGLFQFSSFTSAFMIAIVLSIVNLIITDHLS